MEFTICFTFVALDVLEPLTEILGDLFVVEESGVAAVDDLGSHRAVGANVGQEKTGSKERVRFLNVWNDRIMRMAAFPEKF